MSKMFRNHNLKEGSNNIELKTNKVEQTNANVVKNEENVSQQKQESIAEPMVQPKIAEREERTKQMKDKVRKKLVSFIENI